MTCQKWVILLNFNKSWKIHHLYTWFPRVPCCCFLPYLPRSKHDIKVMFIASLLGILTMGQWVIMYPNYLHNIPIKSAHPSWLVKPSAAASACSQCGHQSPSQRPPWLAPTAHLSGWWWDFHAPRNVDLVSKRSMDWFEGKSTGNHGFYRQI